MTLTITPTGATLGAIVTGVDLANLDDAIWADIECAFLAHAVLIFPGQHLSDAAQIGFGRRFGAIEQLVAGREIVPISNRRADGTLMKDDEHGMQLMRGNEGWHTDKLLHAPRGEGFHLVCACRALGWRTDRVGGHARRLRRARRGD